MTRKFWQRKLSRASKPSPLRPRWRPWIEGLEVRCTPSCTIGLNGRQLLVTCDNFVFGNVVAVSHNVSTAVTTVNGQGFADAAFDTIQINNGSGADVDNVASLPAKPLTVKGGGPNTVNLGNSTHGLKDMLGTVNVFNPPNFSHLNLNDNPGGSGNGLTGTLSVSGGIGTISFTGAGHPANVTYTAADVNELSVDGLNDAFNVPSSAGPGDVNLIHAIQVNLGNPSNGVQSLLARVTVTNPLAGSALNINDGADTGGRTVTQNANGQTVMLVGLAPTTITYAAFGTVNLTTTIIAGHAADVFNVQSTPSNAITHFNSSGGADTINIGTANNGMQSILGQYLVANTFSRSTLNLNDGADPVAQTVTLQDSGGFGSVNGLTGQLGVQYVDTALNALNITAGRAADTINVLSTAAGIPVTLDSGGGADVVIVGNSTNGVQTILGPLAVHNGHATSNLTLDDQADANTGHTVTVSVSGLTGTVSGLAPAPITYATTDLNGLTLTLGKGADEINVRSTAPGVPVAVVGNGVSTVDVGNGPNGARGIVGSVLVFDSFLDVDDQADTFGRTVVMSVSGNIGTITGLGTAPISYATNTLSLSVFGGSGGNTFFVQSTPVGLNTTLHAGSGTNTVNVGNPANTLDGIQGFLRVDGKNGSESAGNTTLSINDQGSIGHTIVVTSTTIQRSGSAEIAYLNIGTLEVNYGRPAAGPLPAVDVESTDVKTAVEIDASNDGSISVGNASDSLDDLQGPVNVVGEGGMVALNVKDDGTATGQGYTLDQGSVTRTGAAPITYEDIQQVVVNGAAGDNNLFDVDGVMAGTPTTINTGTGANDLVRMRGQGMIDDALTLNGQGQDPRIGYVAYTKDVYINLQTGQGTDLAGFSGITDITGGQGNNILVGDGTEASINANLAGGSAGRNLIITGGGTAAVFGSGNGDILIGGTTAYDLDQNGELQDIMAEWTRPDLSYSDRVNHILNGDDPLDPYPLNASTVIDNGAANTITGNSNGSVVNLYYVTNNDVITDQTEGETVINVSSGPGAGPGGNWGQQPASATIAASLVQPRGMGVGILTPIVATTTVTTNEVPAGIAAPATRTARTQGLSPAEDLIWTGDWQPGSLGDLSGF
jgi:hypothetical protein